MISRYVVPLALGVSLYPLSLTWLSFSEQDLARAGLFVLGAVVLASGCALVARTLSVAHTIAVLAVLWLLLCLHVAGPSATLGFLLYGAAALALGARLLLRLKVFTPVERAMLAYLSGASILTAGLSPLLQFPVHYPGTYAALCAVVCIWQRAPLSSLAADVFSQCRQCLTIRPSDMAGTLSLLVVLVWFLGGLGTLTPIAAYDDLALHLRLPYELLVRQQYSFDVSRQIWSVAPWASDLAFAIPFVISQGSEGVKVWVAGSYHFAAAALLFGLLVRRTSIQSALLMLLAYLSIPLVMAVNHTLHTEGISAALVLGIFSLWMSQRHTAAPGVVVGVALLLGFLGALKSSNLVACLLLGLLWSPTLWKHLCARPFAGLPILAALATAATPYITAWVRTGNPVLPLFNGIFKSPFYEAVNFSNDRFSGMFDPGLYASLFLSGSRHLESGLPTVGGLALFFLLPSTAILLAWRGDTERRIALLIALAYALALLSSQQYLRYLFPLMGLAVLAASVVMDVPPTPTTKALQLWRVWCGSLLILAVSVNAFSMPQAFWQTGLRSVIESLHPSGRAAYLASYAPERTLTRAANLDMGMHATVLYGGDPFGADLHGKPIYPNWYNPKAATLFRTVTDEASAAEFVKRMALTHAIPARPTATLTSAETVLNNYLTANGRVIATEGHDSLLALDDKIVWPRTLWALEPAQSAAAINATQAVTGSTAITGGLPILVEAEGRCDGPEALPGIDISWTYQGRPVASFSRLQTCGQRPGQPDSTFTMYQRLQPPEYADGMWMRLAVRNDMAVQVIKAQIRTLAVAP